MTKIAITVHSDNIDPRFKIGDVLIVQMNRASKHLLSIDSVQGSTVYLFSSSRSRRQKTGVLLSIHRILN